MLLYFKYFKLEKHFFLVFKLLRLKFAKRYINLHYTRIYLFISNILYEEM